MPPRSKTSAVVDLARAGLVRPRDLSERGIPRGYLRRLAERGVLEQVDRGLYRLADAPATELHSLAQVAKRVPHATIALLSALQVHGLTTELPHAVWILLDRKARVPKITQPKLEIVRASGAARETGVETRVIEGVPVRITSRAKTVADCFRYRRHVGLDVALAALREYLRRPTPHRTRRAARAVSSIDELVAAATADRIYSVLRPYLEALA